MTSGSLADWLTGAGTVGTLATVVYIEYRGFLARRRDQASLVSVWFDEQQGWTVVVSNRSQQPVYDLCVGWYDPVTHYESGRPGLAWSIAALPPDTVINTDVRLPIRMGHLPSLLLEFIDRAGVDWRREAGSLWALRRRSRLLPGEGTGARWSQLHGRGSHWLRRRVRLRHRLDTVRSALRRWFRRG